MSSEPVQGWGQGGAEWCESGNAIWHFMLSFYHLFFFGIFSPPRHILWFPALYIFKISARFCNTWPIKFNPPNSSSRIGADIHTHSSKCETLKEGKAHRCTRWKKKGKEKVLMESNWCEESQECYRGRWLGLTDGSVLIQHRHNLLP